MTKIYRTLPQEARKRGMWGSFLVFKKIPKVRKKYIYFQIKSCGGGLCKCANERHKNSFVKIVRHDDSKTISWHASFPVRFARLLAALRLNSPLRGSDSGSLGRQHRKPHDGSLATVRAICFRIHHGCIILRTIFYDTVRLHIAKSS